MDLYRWEKLFNVNVHVSFPTARHDESNELNEFNEIQSILNPSKKIFAERRQTDQEETRLAPTLWIFQPEEQTM